eukprot:156030-Chlamydomonas_euryale.AAC.1
MVREGGAGASRRADAWTEGGGREGGVHGCMEGGRQGQSVGGRDGERQEGGRKGGRQRAARLPRGAAFVWVCAAAWLPRGAAHVWVCAAAWRSRAAGQSTWQTAVRPSLRCHSDCATRHHCGFSSPFSSPLASSSSPQPLVPVPPSPPPPFTYGALLKPPLADWPWQGSVCPSSTPPPHTCHA